MAVPSVTTVIPVYNAEQYVSEALASATSQRLENIEILCIDDGSTDASCSIIREWASHDVRIKLLQQKNAGAGAARNLGLSAAQGQFITFLDADDWYSSEKYLSELYTAAAESNQLVSAASFMNYRGPDDIESDFLLSPYYEGYSFWNSGPTQYTDYQFDYGFHRFLFSRTLFEKGQNRFPQLSFFEDPVFLAPILHQAGSFFAVKDVAYMYRCRTTVAHWYTAKLLDLLEGVRRNLVFSSERGLSKLHWYTAHHLDAETGDVGMGVNRKMKSAIIDQKLVEVEAALDRRMLVEVDPSDERFVFGLRTSIAAERSRNLLQTMRGTISYSLKHR